MWLFSDIFGFAIKKTKAPRYTEIRRQRLILIIDLAVVLVTLNFLVLLFNHVTNHLLISS